MAITLDATLGGATSNSYIDMASALAIAANMPGGGDWAALGEEERNLSLIVATRWLETLTYGGNRCATTQRLKWPRTNVTCDGMMATCDAVPYRIQEAEVALALSYTTEPGKFPGAGGGGAAAGTYVKRQKLGSLRSNTTNTAAPPSPLAITAMIRRSSLPLAWLRDYLGCWLGGGVTGGVGLMLRVRS